MNEQTKFDRSPHKRALAVQLRALADTVTRADTPAQTIAEASHAVARRLDSFAREYVSSPDTGKGRI